MNARPFSSPNISAAKKFKDEVDTFLKRLDMIDDEGIRNDLTKNTVTSLPKYNSLLRDYQ